MKLNIYTPKKSLNKAFLKQRPLRSEIELFKGNLLHLLSKVDEIEREENQKNHVRDFLRDTFYKETNEINTKDNKDLVIHLGKSNKDKVGVIIEAKRPSNKNEMLSHDRTNVKALHELVLYYLRERIEENNIDIKYCVVTNIYEWYIIDASYFEKLFFRNKAFVKEYEQWRDKQKVTSDTKLFFESIAKPFIESITEEIPCTYFDIRDYQEVLSNDDKTDDKNLIALLKILSPFHLLKVPFSDDSNKLNSNFYKELLHIIGLEEATEGSKSIIRRKLENRNSGSLIENTISILEVEDPHKVNDINSFGNTKQEQLFSIALELCLTWVNRVMFLKLLEGQIINYHKGDKQYRFLNSDMINDFDELYKLFHQVLAKPINERSDAIQKKYSKVPYLNSYLFDIQEESLEDKTIKINSLDNSLKLEILNTSILKEQKKRFDQIPTLEYLFKFLDAYDFASEGKEDIVDDNKTLINASVLGKVFEKINGYKDGSIYTPGFITMYMCKETLRLAVIQKFNDAYNWQIENIEDLKNFIADKKTSKDILEYNKIINSLRICDPAVGSGHFLVSTLNEIIAIKSDLGLLADSTGARIRDYEIIIENDELIVTDHNGDIFEYQLTNNKPQSKEAQRLQKTLFHEKETIIENCLFGVDINSNSVKICRLRLWIELLKNAYYKEESNFIELETLPNIDINIKCGNSLVNRFALDIDLRKALKSIKYSIEQYRGFVNDYKNERNREVKRGLQKIITSIKSDFKINVGRDSREQKKLDKLSEELFNKYQSEKLFSQKLSAAQLKEKAKLEKQVSQQKKEIEDINSSIIYKNAFEWRFEFPEVLNNDGDFEGFDIVIANPPYIRQEELVSIKSYLKERYNVFVSSGDIFSYFYEVSHNILKEKGKFAFINNTFDKTTAGKILREFASSNFNFKKYIDFTGVTVFEEATTYPIILIAEKDKKQSVFKYFKFTKETFKNKLLINNEDSFSDVSQSSLNSAAWNFLDKTGADLLNKITEYKPLKEIYGKCYYGIKTGFNEAFILEEADYNQILKDSPNDIKIIKPFLEGKDMKKWVTPEIKKWIIFTRRGVEIEKYPAVKKHLEKYRIQLTPKINSDEKSGRKPGPYEWYEIQDVVDYYKYFEEEKIIWPNLQNQNKFCLDNGHRYINAPSVILPLNDKFLLAILNSKVVWHFLKSICAVRSGGFIEVKPQYFDQIPIPQVSPETKKQFEILVDYILFLKTKEFTSVSDQFMPVYFEQILNGMTYELYFPKLILEGQRPIIKHIGILPNIANSKEELKLQTIKTEFDRLNHKENPVRINLFFMDSLPEIRIIESKYENN